MHYKWKKALVEGKLIKRCIDSFIALIDMVIGRFSRFIFSRTTKIQNNKIVFMTYDNDFSCNPKYIAEEIIRQGLPWDLVWLVPNKGSMFANHFPVEIRRVRRNTGLAFQEAASAKIWVDNSINFAWDEVRAYKKPGQYHFETWHGSMGLKRVGAGDVKNRDWVKKARRMRKITDYCISNSEFENNVFKTTHWPDTPILMYGHARNDCLFHQEEMQAARAKVFETLELDEDTRVLLYAPTFRDEGRAVYYEFDYAKLAEALEQRFGGTWKIIVKLHFHDRKKTLQENVFPDCVINATGYTDIMELIMASDAGLSDYSSWSCDYVLTRRPMFLFTPDLEDYNTERGLYYPLETTPFPIAINGDQLIENVLLFDEDEYQKRIDAFLEDKGCVEDGHAAERIVEKFKEIIEK